MNKKRLYFLTVIWCFLAAVYAVQHYTGQTPHAENLPSDLDRSMFFDADQKDEKIKASKTDESAASCSAFTPPFWEGFNTDSPTINCWTIVDNNNDATTPTSSNIWKQFTSTPYEGDQTMLFQGVQVDTSKIPHDDWLISPAFTLDAAKVYQLRYFYKAQKSNAADFKVLLSQSGTALSGFTTTLITKKSYNNAVWEEEIMLIGGISGDIHLAWQVTTAVARSYMFLDQVTLVEVDCAYPEELDVKGVKADQATIVWKDDFNTGWEYIVQKEGEGYPSGTGTSSTTREVTITTDKSGTNLTDNTEYEFYVRSKCSNGDFSDWIGPFTFRTECLAVSWPFTENFETNSTTLNCWTVVDVGNEGTGTTTKTNTWGLYSSSTYAYEGTYSMRFYGTSAGKPFDDWLISPKIKMKNTDMYQLTYYYRTNASYEDNFEVKLSTTGTDPSQFTTTLLASDTYKNGNYEKKILYINGVDGEANIGWHVTSSNSSYTDVYLDNIKLEKIDCIGPEDDITISDLEIDKAKFNWTDTENSQWETYVQAAGSGKPTGSGTLVTSKPVTVTRTNGTGSGNLQPNIEYEFWVRSTCGSGKNSGWVGPFKFRTPCDVQTLPFWEGFNKNSTTLSCWSIIDGNGDSTSATSNIWHMTSTNYEGDQSARFYGTSSVNLPHNDWLISPTFTLDPTKYYRLKYHYRTTSTTSYEYEFAVLMSKTGTDNTSNFTDVVVPKKKYNPSTAWEEKTAYIAGVSGDVNLAWHVTSSTQYTYVYIDNVFIEEVACPEPIELGSKDEEKHKATIYWNDEFNSDWEYIVQKSGGSTPIPTATGTTTKNNEVVITKDKNGDNLEANTEYEFYVRSKCANGKYGEWIGSFTFRTLCDVLKTPFWEGFNSKSESIYCWTILDANGDGTSSSGMWRQYNNYSQYEGSHAMYFYVYDYDNTVSTDDWLISPTFTFDPGKIYRLKYHYKGYPHDDNSNFEVLASNNGIKPSDFTKEVVKDKAYKNDSYIEEKVFISGLSGSVNLVWHVKGTGSKTLYIDNVFVEEVTGCPEPLNLDVKDIDKREATLSWSDDVGASKWEYTVQKAGGSTPTGSGTATTNKENMVTQDASGTTLEPNTEYEFYVRTDCGNGEFSIWQGPYQFITACDIYTTPFWEGFNNADKTYRCWTIIDGNGDATSPTGSNIWRIYNTASGVYEGDQSMCFDATNDGLKPHDDWLISPKIKMKSTTYVLKYRYKTFARSSWSTEILLSSQGIDTTKFTTTVLPTEIYRAENWKEKVVFFNGVAGDINLGWHVNSTEYTHVYLDDVIIKEVETCPEPYYVTVTGQTTTTIDIEWEQYGGITSWEVIVVDYGKDETATPVQTINVKGTSKTKLTGLDKGKIYTIYIRAKCTDGKTYSDWSTPINGGTEMVGANDECSGAVNIPVNSTLECEKTVTGTLLGATESGAAPNTIPVCSSNLRNDVWFEFTATSTAHTLEVLGLEAFSTTNLSPLLFVAIYDQPCMAMVGGNSPIICYTIGRQGDRFILRDLIPDQKYYVRIGNFLRIDRDNNLINGQQPDFFFELCLTTSGKGFLKVSPSGEDYMVEELVKDVLILSDCDLVSNVRYQVGNGSSNTHSVNTLGYFNKNNSIFPFEEGIVLSTSEVQFVPGPYGGGGFGNNPHRWIGDKDINDAINDAGGGPRDDKRVTQLEFDFIPVKDSIKFDYLFASNSYGACTYTCQNGALFAAWLIDATTGKGQNLAKIKGTQTPISLYTIWDNKKIKNTPCSSHPELFWNAYDNGNAHPLEAPINFSGSTIDMSSETVYVVPGRKYHIKLAVMDFCPTPSHSSAVFFSAGSFDLGNLDLGEDLLIETNNALCDEEFVMLKSGIATSEELYTEIEWYKDGVLIPGANGPDLEVNENGEYAINVRFPDLECGSSASIVVEVYPAISETVHQAETLAVCQYSLQETIVDLTVVETAMFAAVDRNIYTTSYYNTTADAETTENTIADAANYSIGKEPQAQTVYIRIENTVTGCHEVFELHIQPKEGAVPDSLKNVRVCAEYIFPVTANNQYYYTEPGGAGKVYKTGDVLAEPGEHTIYLLQVNSEEGCYEETAYQVNITAPVTADVFEDKTLSCEYYELKPLSEYNNYYTEPEGQGTELYEGMQILQGQTIYVYASSEDGLCADENSFTIDYEDCPIPRGISPNNDGLNDVFDLTPHGVESLKIYSRWGTEVYAHGEGYTTQWHGQSKSGKQLPDGTYYYVIRAHGKIRTGWVQINK
ncbi:choice-of-anchor J domain-containing protein [Myroides indicus]|uniref:Cleaved adhesin domain-containing protein n=1 Tax=Myroides indicus TaxID=1323422 RepID=A0A4V6Q0Q4_9FLAO|nr:choice-of-anchor J domain-containing protein [Myroides indicus]TDS57927.1 cleaved adhesin domain-containing protein [Myroides indicus]